MAETRSRALPSTICYSARILSRSPSAPFDTSIYSLFDLKDWPATTDDSAAALVLVVTVARLGKIHNGRVGGGFAERAAHFSQYATAVPVACPEE